MLIFIFSILILTFGVAGMMFLAKMNTPPARRPISHKPLQVKTVKVAMESVTPFITGYGEVKASEITSLSPEIPGKVVAIHPRLESGALVKKGEALFQIDVRDDELSLDTNRKRLSVLKRNLEISQIDFQRMKRLKELVAVSTVEKTEQTYNTMFDQVKQLEYAVYRSELNIRRSVVKAPFDGRVKKVSVAKGQYVSPGTPVITLVNDSSLEVHTAIDAEKAKAVLLFKKKSSSPHPFWFSELEPVSVAVSWSRGEHQVQARGVLDRIIAFDSKSRTLKLAVQLSSKSSEKGSQTDFPIVEGMYCQVEIPGKSIDNIFKIPRQALQSDNRVHIVVKNRLRTVPVSIRWIKDDTAFVSTGLKPDDQVIVTRLSAPLENTRVESSDNEVFASIRRTSK